MCVRVHLIPCLTRLLSFSPTLSRTLITLHRWINALIKVWITEWNFGHFRMNALSKRADALAVALVCFISVHCVFVCLCNIQFSPWKFDKGTYFNRCSMQSMSQWSTSLDCCFDANRNVSLLCAAYVCIAIVKRSQISICIYRNQTTNLNRNKLLQFALFCCIRSRIDAQSVHKNTKQQQ